MADEALKGIRNRSERANDNDKDIALLELITADSNLSIEDTIKIGKEVNRKAWERIKKRL